MHQGKALSTGIASAINSKNQVTICIFYGIFYTSSKDLCLMMVGGEYSIGYLL